MHGYFDTIGVWILYTLGQIAHIAAEMNNVIQDPNHGVTSAKAFLKSYGARLGARFLLTTCMFLIVWDNKSVLNFESLMHSTGSQIGWAGLFGYFSDSAWDKLLAVVPWLKAKLPQIPGGDGQ